MLNLKYNSVYVLQKKSPEAACFDMYSDEDVTIPPMSSKFVSSGTSFDIPKGYKLDVLLRSGFSSKNECTLLNSVGIIDEDYTGVVKYPIFNLSTERAVIIRKGQRIAQAQLVPVIQYQITSVEEITKQTERGSGGFGHTGNY